MLAEFLDSLDSTGVAVNLDPANLVMVTGDDPVQAVYNLRRYIVHTHAKDGIKLADGNPEYIYRVVHPIPEEVQGIRYFKEVPLGTEAWILRGILRRSTTSAIAAFSPSNARSETIPHAISKSLMTIWKASFGHKRRIWKWETG